MNLNSESLLCKWEKGQCQQSLPWWHLGMLSEMTSRVSQFLVGDLLGQRWWPQQGLAQIGQPHLPDLPQHKSLTGAQSAFRQASLVLYLWENGNIHCYLMRPADFVSWVYLLWEPSVYTHWMSSVEELSLCLRVGIVKNVDSYRSLQMTKIRKVLEFSLRSDHFYMNINVVKLFVFLLVRFFLLMIAFIWL